LILYIAKANVIYDLIAPGLFKGYKCFTVLLLIFVFAEIDWKKFWCCGVERTFSEVESRYYLS